MLAGNLLQGCKWQVWALYIFATLQHLSLLPVCGLGAGEQIGQQHTGFASSPIFRMQLGVKALRHAWQTLACTEYLAGGLVHVPHVALLGQQHTWVVHLLKLQGDWWWI